MVRRRRQRGGAAAQEGEDLWDARVLTLPIAGRQNDSDLVCQALTTGLGDLSHGDSEGRSRACAARRKDVWMFLALLDCVVGFQEDAEVYEIWTALDEAGSVGRRLYAERLRLARQVLRGLLQAASCLAHVDGFDRGVADEYDRLGKAMRRFEARLKHITDAMKTLECGPVAEQCAGGRRSSEEPDEALEFTARAASADREPLRLDLLSTAGRMLSPLCEIPRSIGVCIVGDEADDVPQGRRGRAAARRAAAASRAEQYSSGSAFGKFISGATNYIYCVSVGAFIT